MDRCPECGSTESVEIVYGYPTRETEERSMRGEVELGGCMVGPDDRDSRCRACGSAWSSAAPEESGVIVHGTSQAAA